MTTATPTRVPVTAPARPTAAPPPTGVAPAAAVDPVRILRKHWLVLMLAATIGGILGTAGHFTLRKYWPTFRATAIFACQGVTVEVGQGASDDEDELGRFMATQVAQMVSDRVLQDAVRDLDQSRQAETWASRFRGAGTFDYIEAALDLRDRLSARVTSGTNLMTLGMGWRNAPEVKAIVESVRKAYQIDAQRLSNENTAGQTQALKKSIADLTRTIESVTALRNNELREGRFDALEDRTAEARSKLQVANEKLLQTMADLTAVTIQLEDRERDMRSHTGTPTYPESIRQEVEADRSIVDLVRMINSQKAELLRMQELGLGEGHRDVQRVRATIAGLERRAEEERNRLLPEKFNALLDTLRTGKAQYTAQADELKKEIADLQARLQELAQRQAKVNDYNSNLELMTKQKLDFEGALKNLETVSAVADTVRTRITDRITLVQEEQVPTEVSFPKIYIMLPAGVFLALMCVGGVVFLREVLDQRVKGPSDISLIPRTRVVGVVPHAAEDPSRPGAVGTAFVDQPRGAIAESFRQVRAAVLQRMKQAGHRSLLVVSAMPGSGGSSTVANLGAALAAADERVLIIDANFRRPSQHRLFKLTDAPGLGEVLAATQTLEAAARPTSIPNLSVLSCGAAPTRLFERLATERMTAVLAEACSLYDYVLVDTAPAVVSGDSRALADRCDASVLVVRAFSEKRGMVARLKNDLADQRAEFLGVVVNAARSAAGGYFKRNIRATHRYQNAQE